MSTLNHNAATILPIHGSINTDAAVQGIASSSQANKLLPCENNNSFPSQPISIQSSTSPDTSNTTNAHPTSFPSHGNITPSIFQNSNIMNKTRNRKNSETIKDWDKMTLAQRLEATTDLSLALFTEYEWRIENELPCLRPWPPRQQRKN
ncbi:hypothetical protein KCU98_g2222, partial [Aureobasidium melanogenum]